MALIACEECGRQVSSQARSCPQCGMPIAPADVPPSTFSRPIAGIVVACVLGAIGLAWAFFQQFSTLHSWPSFLEIAFEAAFPGWLGLRFMTASTQLLGNATVIIGALMTFFHDPKGIRVVRFTSWCMVFVTAGSAILLTLLVTGSETWETLDAPATGTIIGGIVGAVVGGMLQWGLILFLFRTVPIAKAKRRKGKLAPRIVVFGCLVFYATIAVVLIVNHGDSFRSEVASHAAVQNGQPIVTQEAQNKTASPSGGNWEYSHEFDKMSSGTIYRAKTISTNEVDFDEPYSGPQRATLTIKAHPRYGYHVILSIERGHFLLDADSDAEALVRFDDGDPVYYLVHRAENHRTTSVYFVYHESFYSKMVRSRRVRISMPVYQQGNPVFEFDVSNFDEDGGIKSERSAAQLNSSPVPVSSDEFATG